jgi:hypothetical protein
VILRLATAVVRDGALNQTRTDWLVMCPRQTQVSSSPSGNLRVAGGGVAPSDKESNGSFLLEEGASDAERPVIGDQFASEKARILQPVSSLFI